MLRLFAGNPTVGVGIATLRLCNDTEARSTLAEYWRRNRVSGREVVGSSNQFGDETDTATFTNLIRVFGSTTLPEAPELWDTATQRKAQTPLGKLA